MASVYVMISDNSRQSFTHTIGHLFNCLANLRRAYHEEFEVGRLDRDGAERPTWSQ